jgi:signal transduction histidine kinase
VLTVADDGPGFNPHNAVGPVEGHIGLAQLADAAEGAGGRLDVRSRPGHGTTIKATIPAARSMTDVCKEASRPCQRAD